MANGLKVASVSNYFTTPDSAALSFSADCELICQVSLANWSSGGNQHIYGKRNVAASPGGELSWRFCVDGSGFLNFTWWKDSSTFTQVVSSVATGLSANAIKWLKFTIAFPTPLPSSAGVLGKFYMGDDGSSWTQLGIDVSVAGPTSAIADTTSPLNIAAHTAQPFVGTLYYLEVKNGIGGTTVAKFDASAVAVTGVRTPSSFSDAYGNTWTATGSAWEWTQTTVLPAVVNAVVSIPAPSITTGAGVTNATVAPAVVSVVTTIGVPVESTGEKALPAVVAGVITIPIPILSSGEVVTPANVAVVITVSIPVESTGEVILPAVVVGITAVGVPVISTGEVTLPVTVSGIATVGIPVESTGEVALLATVNGVTSIPSPTVVTVLSVTVTPIVVAEVVTVGAPLVATDEVSRPVVVLAIASIGIVVSSTGISVIPINVAAATLVGVPIATMLTIITPFTVALVTATASVVMHTGSTIFPPTVNIGGGYRGVLMMVDD